MKKSVKSSFHPRPCPSMPLWIRIRYFSVMLNDVRYIRNMIYDTVFVKIPVSGVREVDKPRKTRTIFPVSPIFDFSTIKDNYQQLRKQLILTDKSCFKSLRCWPRFHMTLIFIVFSIEQHWPSSYHSIRCLPTGFWKDPTWTPHGPHTDPTRTPHGPHADPTRTPHAPHTHPTRTLRGPHVDPTRTPHGPHADPTRTQHGPHMDPTRNSYIYNKHNWICVAFR